MVCQSKGKYTTTTVFFRDLILFAKVLRLFLELDFNILQLWLSCSRFFVPFPTSSSMSCSSGSATWNISVLLWPAGWYQLRGSARGGLPAAYPASGLGARRVLSPGPTPSAGHVLHSLQPCCLQEPACHASPGLWSRRLLRQERFLWQGEEG